MTIKATRERMIAYSISPWPFSWGAKNMAVYLPGEPWISVVLLSLCSSKTDSKGLSYASNRLDSKLAHFLEIEPLNQKDSLARVFSVGMRVQDFYSMPPDGVFVKWRSFPCFILLPWSQPFHQTCWSVGLLIEYGFSRRHLPSLKLTSPSLYTNSLCTCVMLSSLISACLGCLIQHVQNFYNLPARWIVKSRGDFLPLHFSWAVFQPCCQSPARSLFAIYGLSLYRVCSSKARLPST